MKRFQLMLSMVTLTAVWFAYGCQGPDPVPTFERYGFIRQDEKLSEYYSKVYDPAVAREYKIAAFIVSPQEFDLAFNDSISRPVSLRTADEALKFGVGVYPFVLKKPKAQQARYCGAIMVCNADEILELAAFGRTADTRMFKTELLTQVSKGVLVKQRVSYNGRPVFAYWLGNRNVLYAGGNPTVEVDFSQTPNIESFSVTGLKTRDYCAMLDVYGPQSGQQCPWYQDKSNAENYISSPRPVGKQYEFRMALANGIRYRGYIRNLTSNAYTAFVRIPCIIPQELLDAAADGRVAIFTVHFGTEADKEPIAEIVFGLDTGQ